MAKCPAVLQNIKAAFGALDKGNIGDKLGEQLAVAIANYNRGEYCIAASTVLGQKTGVGLVDMSAAHIDGSGDPIAAAALGFAWKVVSQRA